MSFAVASCRPAAARLGSSCTTVRVPGHRAASLAIPLLHGRSRCAAPLVEASASSDSSETTTTATPAAAQHSWLWRGHKINYMTAGCGKPVLLVHGFGASSRHFRKNMLVLAQQYKVYAVDLLGFGASDKPAIDYSIELWANLLADFAGEFIQQPTVVMGNSVGSLASLTFAAQAPESVAGVVLFNCAGGMNNKAIADDWRIKLAMPIFLLIDLLLKQEAIARYLFDSFRTPDNIRNVLQNVYPANPSAVDDELVELIYRPSCDEGALGAFVSVVTGPPGPRPEQLVPQLGSLPLLVLWGTRDSFTPSDGPVGRYFEGLEAQRAAPTAFVALEGAGHCPMDELPQAVHDHLLPWLAQHHA